MKKTIKRGLILLIISGLFLMYYQLSFGQEGYKSVNAFPNIGTFTLVTDIQFRNHKVYVCQSNGKIYVFDNSPNVSVRKTFANLSSIVSEQFGGQGAIGLAFSPYFETNRHIYVSYTYASNQDSIVYWALAQFTVSATNPDSVITSSKIMIIDSIKFDKPGHYGGRVIFRNDNGIWCLYYGLGDNSWDNDTLNNRGYLAQDLTNLYGKVIRIIVDTTTSQYGNYAIPSDNPFTDDTTGKRKEIYSYGHRNPWRMSLDALTNTLWQGDVGENVWEEINIIEKGRNYGWNIKVGLVCNYYFPPPFPCDTVGKNLKDPFYTYQHHPTLGGSVIGGYVYRGHQFPELYGKYIFADWVLGKVWALNVTTKVADLLFDTTNFSYTTFGQDENGELYLGTSKTNDVIYKLSSPKLNLTCLIQGFYNTYNDNKMIKDTVRVYIRNATSPYVIVDSNKVMLDSTGKGTISFPLITNGTFYYLQVNHRNSIETWSATTQRFQNGIINYNFTTAASQAYGNNLVLKNGKYCIYNGDVNQDGIIDASDLGAVDNAVYNYQSGYVQTDLNGDDFVDSSDLAIVDKNASDIISRIKP